MTKLALLDLGLLQALDALVSEQSVSRAANQIGLSQPALSHALKRLRLIFDDEILVRDGGAMVPTRRALELREGVADALAALRRVVEGPEAFDPASHLRQLSIVMSDAVALMMLPELVRRVRAAAPAARLTATQGATMEGVAKVRSGEADAALGMFDEIPPGIASREISRRVRLVAVADRSNPRLIGGRMDLDAYLTADHVSVERSGAGTGAIDEALALLGRSRNVSVVAPNFNAVPAIVRGTELVGHCAPHVLDQLAYRDELALFSPPVPLPPRPLCVIWRPGGALGPARNWLVDLIEAIVDECETAYDEAGQVPA